MTVAIELTMSTLMGSRVRRYATTKVMGMRSREQVEALAINLVTDVGNNLWTG